MFETEMGFCNYEIQSQTYMNIVFLFVCTAILYVTKQKQENHMLHSMQLGYNTCSFHEYADTT